MAVFAFLHDGYADWELGYVLPEVASPPVDAGIEKRTREVVTFGLSAGPIRSMGNLQVAPDVSLAEVRRDEVEALILPGGVFWRRFDSTELDDLVTDLAGRGTLVAAICAATGYLARLGLLDQVQHTSNSLAFLKERAPRYAGGDKYQQRAAVIDRGIITAGGLNAVDFTDAILRALEVYPPPICDIWHSAFKHGEDPEATAGS